MAVSGDQSDMLTVGVTMPKSSDSKPPKPPSDSSVLLTAFSGSRIDVVWAASVSPDIAAYQVRRDGTLVPTIDRPDPQGFRDGVLPFTVPQDLAGLPSCAAVFSAPAMSAPWQTAHCD